MSKRSGDATTDTPKPTAEATQAQDPATLLVELLRRAGQQIGSAVRVPDLSEEALRAVTRFRQISAQLATGPGSSFSGSAGGRA